MKLVKYIFIHLLLFHSLQQEVVAQTVVTIGTGTGAGTTSPAATYYNGSATESIYLASEIGVAGSITQIEYYKNSGASTTSISVKIYMKTTAAANVGTGSYSVGASGFSAYSLVYDGLLPNTASSGWMPVILDAPFSYTNTANLSVLVVASTCISSGRPQYRYTTQADRKTGTYNDGSIGCGGNNPWTAASTLTAVLERPNARLTVMPQSCNAPTGLTVNSITYNGAVLNWAAPAAGNAPVGYQWEVRSSGSAGSGTSGLAGNGSTTVPTVSAPVTGLQPNTTYYVYVRTFCGGSAYSNWTAATVFTTACNQVLSVTPAGRCGPGTVTLSATTGTTGILQWFAASSGGTAIAAGNNYTTAPIAADATFYVSAKTVVTTSAGPLDIASVSNGFGSTNNGEAVVFDLSAAKKLLSVTIYPQDAATDNIIYLKNSSGSILQQLVFTVTSAEASAAVPGSPYLLTLNWDIPAGNGYRLEWGMPHYNGANRLWRNTSGAASYYKNYPAPGITFTGNTSAFGNNYWFYFYNWVFNADTCESARVAVTASIVHDNTWNGTVSNNWFNTANWNCSQVPSATSNVIIPGSLVNYPVIESDTAAANTILIQSGAALTVKNTGALQVAGSINNNGTFNSVDGAVKLSGTSPQTISGNTFYNNTIKKLIIDNLSATLGSALNDTLVITHSLSFGAINNAVFQTNNNLILRSGKDTTAQVTDLTNGGHNTGNSILGSVIVERYIPARRAWRLLTAPVNDALLTINKAWQGGLVNNAGFTQGSLAGWGSANMPDEPGRNTHITGGSTRNNRGFGFDPAPFQPSIRAYTGNWGTAAYGNVNTTNDINDGGGINGQQGYMLFVRGDRNVPLPYAAGAAASATVLRPKGPLNTGNKNVLLPGTAGFKVIGNPYAAAINFSSFFNRNADTIVNNAYYLWDPNLTGSNGVGAFVCFVFVSPGVYTPTVFSPATQILPDGTIPSGAAFLVNAQNTGTVTFSETDKINNVLSSRYFRPVPDAVNKLRINLLALNADGSRSLNDGVLVLFDDDHTNSSVDDVPKSVNFAESISLQRENRYLAAEKRKPVIMTDTFFLAISNMQLKSYQLEIFRENFTGIPQNIFIIDKFLNTTSPLHIENTGAIVNFSITNDPASRAKDRFKLVFNNTAVLPISFNTVIAIRITGETVKIEWTVPDPLEFKEYEVQKSIDGINFITIAIINATVNTPPANLYKWIDQDKSQQQLFYRVKGTGKNGRIIFSNIVRVKEELREGSVTAVNSRAGKEINLLFTNMPAAKYSVRIYDAAGNELCNELYDHIVAAGAVPVRSNCFLPHGVYFIKVSAGGKSYLVKTIH